MYIHPWELDPAQPRILSPLVSRFRHYVNLRGTNTKLQRLLDGFSFESLRWLLKPLVDKEKP